VSVDLRRVYRLAWRALFVVAVLASVPLFTVPMLRMFHQHALYDFRGGLYNAGTAILNGVNPYHAGFLAHQAAIMRAGGVAIGETVRHSFSLPVYPAPANLAVVPLSLLPFWLAGTIYTVLSIGAMLLALWWLDVRDWRCYGLTAISWPFLYGLMLGALGPFLVLGAAAAWRWRDRLWPPAIGVAAIVVAKIFPWTLAVWLLVTKRYRALALAVALGAGVTLVAWAAIGFTGMLQYPAMLANVSFIQELRASSLVAILLALGLSPLVATAVGIAGAGGLLLAAWRAFRKDPGDDARSGDRAAFSLAILAALTAAPIVWDHYFVLLLIPIALRSPRFSSLWFIPMTPPMLVVTSAAIWPLQRVESATHPDTIRSAIVWVALQAIVLLSLYLSKGEVRAFRHRALERLWPSRSRSARAGVSAA
jgi:hypothetical protein